MSWKAAKKDFDRLGADAPLDLTLSVAFYRSSHLHFLVTFLWLLLLSMAALEASSGVVWYIFTIGLMVAVINLTMARFDLGLARDFESDYRTEELDGNEE